MSLSPGGFLFASHPSTPSSFSASDGNSSASSSSISLDLQAYDEAPSTTPPIHDKSQSHGTYSPRFDKYWRNSDLLLRTSDDVIFRVHKARLAGSSVFEDMFEIGSLAEGAPEDKHSCEESPIVTLTEDAATLELILPFFYDEYPDVDSMAFEDVLCALQASLKYGMALVEHIYTARMRRMLPTLRVDQAFILWARCSSLDKADLASEALKYTAKGDIMQFATSDIDMLGSRSVDRLWRTHMKYTQSRTDKLFTYAWRNARGKCYYFQQAGHSQYMKKLLQAKSTGLQCDEDEPLGFRECDKCAKMAEELGLF